MANPIMSAMKSMPQQQNNIFNMMQAFADFKKQIGNQNPQAIIQGLIQNGQMSQQQFEQLRQQAESIAKMLK